MYTNLYYMCPTMDCTCYHAVFRTVLANSGNMQVWGRFEQMCYNIMLRSQFYSKVGIKISLRFKINEIVLQPDYWYLLVLVNLLIHLYKYMYKMQNNNECINQSAIYMCYFESSFFVVIRISPWLEFIIVFSFIIKVHLDYINYVPTYLVSMYQTHMIQSRKLKFFRTCHRPNSSNSESYLPKNLNFFQF